MTLIAQGIIFGTMLLTGMLLGLWLDLFRFINRRGRTPFPFFLDCLFWAVTTCVVFVVLFQINFLELRMYVFFSLALGLLIYLKIFSCQILHLYGWGFAKLEKMIKWIWRVIRPLSIPLRAASGLVDSGVKIFLNLFAWLAVRTVVFNRSRQDNPPVA